MAPPWLHREKDVKSNGWKEIQERAEWSLKAAKGESNTSLLQKAEEQLKKGNAEERQIKIKHAELAKMPWQRRSPH